MHYRWQQIKYQKRVLKIINQLNPMKLKQMIRIADAAIKQHYLLFMFFGIKQYLSIKNFDLNDQFKISLYLILNNFLIFGWQSICYHILMKNRQITVYDIIFGGYNINIAATFRMIIFQSFWTIFSLTMRSGIEKIEDSLINLSMTILMLIVSIYLSQANYLIIQNRHPFSTIPSRSINLMEGHVGELFGFSMYLGCYELTRLYYPILSFYFESLNFLIGTLFFIYLTEEKQFKDMNQRNPYQYNRQRQFQRFNLPQYGHNIHQQQEKTPSYSKSTKSYIRAQNTPQKRQIPHSYRDQERAKTLQYSFQSSSRQIKESLISSLSYLSRSFSRDSDDSYKAFARLKEKQDKKKLYEAKQMLKRQEKEEKRRKKQMEIQRQQKEERERREWQRENRQKSKKKKKVIKQIITLEESSED